MQNVEQWHLLREWCPKKNDWKAFELLGQNPIDRVKQIMGGFWTKRDGHLEHDMCTAFYNEKNGRRVFVLRMPKGLEREACVRVMRA